MKVAFMFSGQGSQYLGMGKDLFEKFSCVQDVFQKANIILGYDLKEVMFENEEKLNQTKYTQTAMFVMYQAILKVLKENNITADYSFGLSLGEYGAYLHNGVFDFETGLLIVNERGRLMDEASKTSTGKMAAILSLPTDILEDIIDSIEGYVKIANYNTYGQLVISGEAEAVDICCQKAKEKGAKRVIPLNTSGAFHTLLMKDAADKFGDYLKNFKLQNPNKNLLLNTTGKYFDGNIKEVMIEQITNSVRLYQTIELLIEDGVDTFIEIGPKRTLSSFVKKINKDVNILNVENIESLNNTVSAMEGK